MDSFTNAIRVSYSDTDKMGFVLHSNYLKYYETARWHLFRHLGIPYKEIEEAGFLLPVVNVQMQFLKPAFYDEELLVETSIKGFKGAKLVLDYKLFNAAQELINTATITVAFVNTITKKPCKPPEYLQEILLQALQEGLQPA